MNFKDDFPSLTRVHICRAMTKRTLGNEHYIPMVDVEDYCFDKLRVKEAINKIESKIREKRKKTPGLQLATAMIIELRNELRL